MKSLEIGSLLDFYAPMLTQKQRLMLELYHNRDYSLSEIATSEHISRQAVMDTLQRGERMLASLESKLGLLEKYRLFQRIVDECIELNRAQKYDDLKKCLESLSHIWEDDHGI
ncbi:MAG: YlxM family DNA-binding protein [Christensenellales bacterium]|jgi:predicted DNA-binding protein YlxM (UPF0122 family)